MQERGMPKICKWFMAILRSFLAISFANCEYLSEKRGLHGHFKMLKRGILIGSKENANISVSALLRFWKKKSFICVFCFCVFFICVITFKQIQFHTLKWSSEPQFWKKMARNGRKVTIYHLKNLGITLYFIWMFYFV